MKPEERLISLVKQELRSIETDVIIPENQGFRAFGTYLIKPNIGGIEVWQQDIKIGNFGSQRSAISWCVADRLRQYELAQQIKDLDQRSKWTRETIEQRSSIADRSKNSEFKELIRLKIQHRRVIKTQIDAELEKCIKRTKYLQYRGFTNDTQRTGQNGSKKTSH